MIVLDIRRSLLLLLAPSVLLACAAQPSDRPLGAHTVTLGGEESTSTWSATTAHLPGRLVMDARLRQGDRWKVRFSEQLASAQSDSFQSPPLEVIVTDGNCDFGHEVVIEHRVDERTLLRGYPKTQVRFGEEMRLSVEWKKDNTFTVIVNGEPYTGKVYKDLAFFSVINMWGKQQFDIEYTSETDKQDSQP